MKNIIPLVLIIAAILGFSFFVRPLFDSAKPLQAEIESYELALEKAGELESLIEAKKVDYNNLPSTSLSRLGQMIPDSDQTVHVFADINALAQKYGSAINKISTSHQSPPNQADSQAVKMTIISFEFSATYPKLIAFIKDLEKSLRVMDIQSISFTTKDSGVYDYRISLGIYSMLNQ